MDPCVISSVVGMGKHMAKVFFWMFWWRVVDDDLLFLATSMLLFVLQKFRECTSKVQREGVFGPHGRSCKKMTTGIHITTQALHRFVPVEVSATDARIDRSRATLPEKQDDWSIQAPEEIIEEAKRTVQGRTFIDG